MDADQHPREPPFEEMRRKNPAPDQRRQSNQRSRNQSERSGAGVQPPRRPTQRKQEAAEAADPENSVEAAEGQVGTAVPSERRCRTASTVPNSKAVERMTKAAISMTG